MFARCPPFNTPCADMLALEILEGLVNKEHICFVRETIARSSLCMLPVILTNEGSSIKS